MYRRNAESSYTESSGILIPLMQYTLGFYCPWSILDIGKSIDVVSRFSVQMPLDYKNKLTTLMLFNLMR